MPERIVDGVRLGNVRRCPCGRDPEIVTAYDGQEPGFGPFVLKCYCGRDPDTPTPADAHGIVLPTRFARSWVKTRGVKIWNRIAGESARQAATRRGSASGDDAANPVASDDPSGMNP